MDGDKDPKKFIDYFDTVFWGKIWKALQKLLGAMILIGFHFLLDFLFKHVFSQYPLINKAASVILLVAFIIIYFILVVGMVRIFLPERRPKPKGAKRIAKGT